MTTLTMEAYHVGAGDEGSQGQAASPQVEAAPPCPQTLGPSSAGAALWEDKRLPRAGRAFAALPQRATSRVPGSGGAAAFPLPTGVSSPQWNSLWPERPSVVKLHVLGGPLAGPAETHPPGRPADSQALQACPPWEGEEVPARLSEQKATLNTLGKS